MAACSSHDFSLLALGHSQGLLEAGFGYLRLRDGAAEEPRLSVQPFWLGNSRPSPVVSIIFGASGPSECNPSSTWPTCHTRLSARWAR